MPLPKHVEKAQVIITKLDQPHRFDFAMQCACGFQHHGFAAAGSNPVTNDDGTVTPGIDPASEMIAAATAHLAQKHGVDPAEASKFIEVTPFTTTGGMSHDMLKGRLVAHNEKASHPSENKITTGDQGKAPGIENIKVTTPPQSQPSGVSKENFSTAGPLPNTGTKPGPGLMPPPKPSTSTGTKLNEFPASPQLSKPNLAQPNQPAQPEKPAQVQPGEVKK